MASFEEVKAGDIVHRSLGGMKPHPILVGEVKGGLIYCGSVPHDDNPFEVPCTGDEAWKFRVENGAEVDESLGWDGTTTTGSFLVKKEE
jgi:hypothetical protein